VLGKNEPLLTDAKPCTTADDFRRLPFSSQSILAQSSKEKARRVHDYCESTCPSPCTRYVYGWKDDSYESQTQVLENRTALLYAATKTDVNIEMFVNGPYATAVEESYAFTFVQLLSELGGSWGLLLGFSFLEFLPVIERFLSKRPAICK
jgi:hypothetical protein